MSIPTTTYYNTAVPSPCGCGTPTYPVTCICSGYIVRDPLAATYPPAKPPEFFVYDSKGAKNEWTIDHNLGFPPNVATWGKDPDSKPTVPIQGEVLHTNQNSLVIKFLVPVDGVAYLS